MKPVRKLAGALVAAALLLAPLSAAHADTYPTGSAGQDFSTGTAGWDQSTSFSGLCLQGLLCPAVLNSWAGGGADGNGYISTRFGTLVSTVAGSSTGTWSSPAFTYDGYAGKTPASVSFDMYMLKDVQAFLDLSVLNDTAYQVDLVDQTNGTAVSVVPSTPVAPNGNWAAIPTASVSPALLTIGRAYKLQITTTYHAVLSAVALGEVGYDDVRLTTAPGPVGPNGGSGITNIKQLRKLTKTYILPGSAKVSGHLLSVKLRCPAIATPKPCQIQFAGLQAGKFSKAATARKVVKLKAGKERTVKLRIKPKYVAAYTKATKIWTKAIVRVGKVRATVRKRMKL